MLVAGCRRAPPQPEVVGDEGAADPSAARPLLVGPGTWSDTSRVPLEIEVPAGWTLQEGEHRSERLRVTLRDGVFVTVAMPASLDPRASPDCAWVSVDRVGRHRDVPAIAPAALATCRPIEVDGSTIFAWIGQVDGKAVHIELHLGPGELVEGRDQAMPLLGGISAWRAGAAAPR